VTLMPNPARYCGRCGAPLAPGAAFCGRCGTPVALQAAVAPAPVYRYAPAPRAAYPTGGQPRLGPVAIAGGLVAVLVIAALAAGLLAVNELSRGGNRAVCTVNCAPKFVTPLAEQASYRSSAFGYQVNYSARWTIRAQDASGITLGTKFGQVQVTGTHGSSAQQALDSAIAGLPTSTWQNVTLVDQLKGAHLGEVQGVGAVYSANLLGTSQTATRVRIGIIAASNNGVTVVVLLADPADPKGSPNGLPEGQQVDYLCTEFVWG